MRSLLVVPPGAKRRRRPRPFAEGLWDGFEPPPPPAPAPMPPAPAAALESRYGAAPAPAAAAPDDPWAVEGDAESWPAGPWDKERWEPTGPAEVSHMCETAEADGIPAAVARIRLIGGLAAGEYRRLSPDQWLSERGNVCSVDALNRAYVAGRVAILADAPPIARPAPAVPAAARPGPSSPRSRTASRSSVPSLLARA